MMYFTFDVTCVYVNKKKTSIINYEKGYWKKYKYEGGCKNISLKTIRKNVENFTNNRFNFMSFKKLNIDIAPITNSTLFKRRKNNK